MPNPLGVCRKPRAGPSQCPHAASAGRGRAVGGHRCVCGRTPASEHPTATGPFAEGPALPCPGASPAPGAPRGLGARQPPPARPPLCHRDGRGAQGSGSCGTPGLIPSSTPGTLRGLMVPSSVLLPQTTVLPDSCDLFIFLSFSFFLIFLLNRQTFSGPPAGSQARQRLCALPGSPLPRHGSRRRF